MYVIGFYNLDRNVKKQERRGNKYKKLHKLLLAIIKPISHMQL
jgi:hypothetical protein